MPGLAEAEFVANPAKHDLKCRYYVNDVCDISARMNELPSGPDGEAYLRQLEGNVIARHEVRTIRYPISDADDLLPCSKL